MSEEERKRRADYLAKRKRRIGRSLTLITAVVILAIVAGVLASVFNKTYYVNYSEQSSVDYGVYLKENDDYGEGNDYLGKDYDYIAALINQVRADFAYSMQTDAEEEIDFDYSYRIDAVIEIKDKSSEKPLYTRADEVVKPIAATKSNGGISVKHTALVDYVKYNEEAERFIRAYDLSYAEAHLYIKMYVDITSESKEFDANKNVNDYVASVKIPLAVNTVKVQITSQVPESDGKILSYSTKTLSKIFTAVSIASGAIALLGAALLLFYVEASKNHDVTYENRISRLVAAYKSYIQRLRNHFDTAGYQVLLLSEFNEMLEIRDTIQSPILMDENDDKTCTHFLIPTATNILYMFEIKVGDYDDIYSPKVSAEDVIDIRDTAEEKTEVVAPADVVTPADVVAPAEVVSAPAAKPEQESADVKEAAKEESTEAKIIAPESTEAPAEEVSGAAEPEIRASVEEIVELPERDPLLVLVHADPDFIVREAETSADTVEVNAPTNVTVGKGGALKQKRSVFARLAGKIHAKHSGHAHSADLSVRYNNDKSGD